MADTTQTQIDPSAGKAHTMSTITAPASWTDAGHEPLNERSLAIVETHRDEYTNHPARVFHRYARSHRSTYGYQPPLERRRYAKALAIVANMAAFSDRFADIASAIRINRYGTSAQAAAAVCESIAKTMSEPWDDVIARTGPEPSRYSDAQRAWTITDVLHAIAFARELIAALVPGEIPALGWVDQYLAHDTGVWFYINNSAYHPDIAARNANR